MNVLLFRALSQAEIDSLRRDFPSVNFRQTTELKVVLRAPSWPVVVWGNLPATIVATLPRLRWLQIVSSGIDDYLSLADSKVIITTARGLHASIIAQHILMTMLMFERGQSSFHQAQIDRAWRRQPEVPRRIEGLTLGLIGCGAIGREVSRLVASVGVRTIATKRTTTDQPIPHVSELLPWTELDRLLTEADHLVLALPLTPDTSEILSADRIAKLKQSAYVHNVSRGALVDEPALLQALKSGRIAGAALDTFTEEPLPRTSPWWTMPNVVITPHIAGHHRDLGSLNLERFSSNLRRWLGGDLVQPIADLARGY